MAGVQPQKPEWQDAMSLECATEKQINITSYGDWGLSLTRTPLKALGQPFREIVVKSILEDRYYYYEKSEEQGDNQPEKPQKPQIRVDEYPQVSDIKDAFSHVWVNIHESEEWFRNKYGFWKIQQFKTYEQDGNGCRFTFQTKDHANIGSYGTS